MNNKIPKRSELKKEDCWNLSKLFAGDTEWEMSLKDYERKMAGIEDFKGNLGKSPENLKNCLDFMMEMEILDERLGYYAYLKTEENAGDSKNQERLARFTSLSSKKEALSSYQIPEIQAIPDSTMKSFLSSKSLEDYVIFLTKILRLKPHVLSEKEEKLLAMQAEANQTASKAFSVLTNVDFEFGLIETPEGKKPLTQSTYSAFLLNPDRQIRKKAYDQFYSVFEKHKNTLTSLLAGSVHLDIYNSRVRNFPSARAAKLFPDKVSEKVYDNLISTVNDNLDLLHRYYDFRRKSMNLDFLHLYDLYVPLVNDMDVRHTYDEAVEKVIDSLHPLGGEYCSVLKNGLLNGWVDRYENQGKSSGAFSAGSYPGDPYILMNFKEEVLRDVFTLAHEGGHSMHSWYSVANNPVQHYNYTIFEAEVASTFNEQLLAKYMLDGSESKEMEAYLLGKQIDDIIGTIYRQTMFAEFEHIIHRMTENNHPLTVDSVREEYTKLLRKYFGNRVKFEDNSNLEGLRIPHFYRSFYVYKYATGLAASISLSKKVLEGGGKDREDYLRFLKSGGSKYPVESLKLAGVDMSKTEPVENAMGVFKDLLTRLEKL